MTILSEVSPLDPEAALVGSGTGSGLRLWTGGLAAGALWLGAGALTAVWPDADDWGYTHELAVLLRGSAARWRWPGCSATAWAA